MNVIEVDGGGVELSGRPILRGIDLAVPAGQVVALLGANGSGKSTLVKSMVGLLPLSMGTTRLFGTQVTSFTEWSRVGYVPQRSTMTQGVPSTVREVVAAGRLARRRPFLPERAADRTAIADALEAVGLADRAGQTVATLSGGQQRRVLMARTLAGGPELLLLDEPLAGVDVISQQALADALAVRAAAGATVVLVLHELGPFEPLIQRTVVLREGRIVHDGEPAGIAAFVHDHDVHCAPAVEPVPIAPLADPFGGGA